MTGQTGSKLNNFCLQGFFLYLCTSNTSYTRLTYVKLEANWSSFCLQNMFTNAITILLFLLLNISWRHTHVKHKKVSISFALMHIKQTNSSYEQRAKLQLKRRGKCVKTVNTEGCRLVRNPFIGKKSDKVKITAIMARKCKMNGCLKEIVMTLPIFCSKQWLHRTAPQY